MPRSKNCARRWARRSDWPRCGGRSSGCRSLSKKSDSCCRTAAARCASPPRRLDRRSARLGSGQLVFIDESGARTNLVRQYGRSLRGRRLVAYAPHGHWKATTFVVALREEGLTAPMVLDGAMNGRPFWRTFGKCWCPRFSRAISSCMDNLSSHKSAGCGRPSNRRVRTVDVPAALQPRPQPDRVGLQQTQVAAAVGRRTDGRCLWSARTNCSMRSPHQCRNYFRHCGYRVSPA